MKSKSRLVVSVPSLVCAPVQPAAASPAAPTDLGEPLDRRIEFRIGIHIGDVVEESDGDLMGDGVNIAARLEGVAAPVTICLSEDAYREVRSRLDLLVSDLGQTQLKNIDHRRGRRRAPERNDG
ncbi:class 3 adenylate cyclase [Mesorhizobium sp. URHB0026]